MLVRIERSRHSGTYEYLQIVESVRERGQVRQRVVANLGRLDQLVSDGSLDALSRSLAKFSERLRVIQRVREQGLEAHTARSWRPALGLRRLWQEQGIPELLRRLARDRRFEFDLERV